MTGRKDFRMVRPSRLLAAIAAAVIVATGAAAAQESNPTQNTVTVNKLVAVQTSTPAAPTVAPQGTTGATTYSYRVSCVNSTGQTLASSAGTTATGNAALSSTNFNRVTWKGVAGCSSYKVYGRTSGSELLIATVAPQLLRYDDTGAVTPSGALPGANTTAAAIEVGNVSDTTVTRASAGRLAVEGVNVPLVTDNLSTFGSTTCANFASVISGETGTCGAVVLSDAPDFTTKIRTPKIETASGDLTIDPTANTIVKGSTTDNTALALDVQTSNGTSILAVRNDGNVGIGTTNPESKVDVRSGTGGGATEIRALSTDTSQYANLIVDVNGGVNNRAQFVSFGSSAAGTMLGISRANNSFFVKSGGALGVGTRDASPLLLGTNEQEQLRISSDGNVGIGTTNPGSKLDINGDIAIGANSGSANPVTFSATAPTISSGFGTGASVTVGKAVAFRLNVGTGGTANSGVVGLPTATNGWNCHAENLSSNNATQFITKQTASSTTTATFGNYDAAGAAAAWAASDVLAITCTAL